MAARGNRKPFQALEQWALPAIMALQAILHVWMAVNGRFPMFELFRIVLLGFNGLVCCRAVILHRDRLLSGGLMLLVAGHALWGHAMTPTTVASAAMLMGNLMVLYVGMQIFQHCSRTHRILFVTSYLLLFVVFILRLEHAEPLFLLSLLGLAGTARDLKLLSYFWAIVISFTFAQPYAWECVIALFLILKMMYSARNSVPSATTKTFLAAGLLLLFTVLLPVLVMMFSESPHNLFNLLKDGDVMRAVATTAWTATLATAILVAISLPAAFAIVRTRFSGKALLLSLIDIPIIIPQSVAGIALLKVFGKQQVLGSMLYHAFGIRFDGTWLGIVAAQVFIAMPFMMRAAMAAFEAVPEKYELAARNLGANAWQAYFRIALPLAGRGLFLGAVLAWARAAGEFGAVFFIASSPETAPIAVYTRFMSMGLSETAPLVSLLLFFSVGMFFLLQTLSRTFQAPDGQLGGRT